MPNTSRSHGIGAKGATIITATCQHCGKVFSDYASNRVGQPPKYCSVACYHAASRKDVLCSCEWCGTPFLRTSKHKGKRFCSVECACKWKRTRRRVTVGNNGYRYIWLSDGSSKKEHIDVMERALGRPLAKGECVHHIDGNRANNDISNLRLMTIGEHSRLHREEDKRNGKILFGNNNARRMKSVIGTDASGNVLKFESLSAARRAGFYHVDDCCRGIRQTDKGFAWRYDNDR